MATIRELIFTVSTGQHPPEFRHQRPHRIIRHEIGRRIIIGRTKWHHDPHHYLLGPRLQGRVPKQLPFYLILARRNSAPPLVPVIHQCALTALRQHIPVDGDGPTRYLNLPNARRQRLPA